MTNYMSISTCAATGSNTAIANEFALPCPNPKDYLGQDACWDQRRAFEWGYLGYLFEKSGDAARAEYCYQRIQDLKAPYRQ